VHLKEAIAMCSLCGVLGGNEHWTDAAARPGVFTRNHASVDRRREGAERVRAASETLSVFGLVPSDWQGRPLLASPQRLVGRACDPLDMAFIARMEARHVD